MSLDSPQTVLVRVGPFVATCATHEVRDAHITGIDSHTYFLTHTRVECDDHIVHDRDIELPREVQDALRDREYHSAPEGERTYLHGGEAIGERVRPSLLWWSMAKQTWLT